MEDILGAVFVALCIAAICFVIRLFLCWVSNPHRSFNEILNEAMSDPMDP